MADNTVLNAGGGGDTVATEDVGGIKYQRVKTVRGVHGAAALATLLAHVVAAASNNAANIKNAGAHLFSVHVFNNAAYPIYVKFYDKATAPAPNVDTPKLTIGVQAGTQRDVLFDPADFPTGLGLAIVKGIADNDNTAVAASDGAVDVEYL